MSEKHLLLILDFKVSVWKYYGITWKSKHPRRIVKLPMSVEGLTLAETIVRFRQPIATYLLVTEIEFTSSSDMIAYVNKAIIESRVTPFNITATARKTA